MQERSAKIDNLYVLKEEGFGVPPFFIVDKKFIKFLDKRTIEIKNYFEERGVKDILIRSASSLEDGSDNSMAGIFESSKDILLKDLGPNILLKFWNKNKEKAENNIGLVMFVQEYFVADYYGVLFTQDIYDQNFSILHLSSAPGAVTDGKDPGVVLKFDRKKREWGGDLSVLSKNILNQIELVIKKLDKKFINGADIELGIKKDLLRLFQLRPITRTKKDKLILFEKHRLKEKLGSSFEQSKWERNQFVQALGKLSTESINFYNKLLNSNVLNTFLFKNYLIDKKSEHVYDLLDNIGSKLYYNIYAESIIFYKKPGKMQEFRRLILFLANEKNLKKNIILKKEKDQDIEMVFAIFFVSGIYFNYFLEKEKKRTSEEIFSLKLLNTEIRCNALEPRPKSKLHLDNFRQKYYYLSSNPYEISSKKINDYTDLELFEKYKFFFRNRAEDKIEIEDHLDYNSEFWLKEKLYWKRIFLIMLYKHKLSRGNFATEKIEGLSKKINAVNFPFSDNEEEVHTIVPGIIDYKDLKILKLEDEITDYFNCFIAIDFFPAKWISFIPTFKGLVTKEGNKLSHLSITCREYQIPYQINTNFFKK